MPTSRLFPSFGSSRTHLLASVVVAGAALFGPSRARDVAEGSTWLRAAAAVPGLVEVLQDAPDERPNAQQNEHRDETSTDAPPIELEFESVSHKILLRGEIEGEPCDFILDSGNGGRTILARETAIRLGLPIRDETRQVRGAGMGDTTRVGSTDHVHIDFGPLVLGARPITMDLAHVARFEGRPIDGILGHQVFDQFVVEIDYPERRLRLHDPRTWTYGGDGTIVDLEWWGRIPAVRGAIETPEGPVSSRIVLDTGARFGVIVFRPFAERRRLHDLGRVEATIGGGLGGPSRALVTRLDGVRLGAWRIPAPAVGMSLDTSGVFAGNSIDALVGGPVLERATVIFDYATGRVIFEPVDDASPIAYDRSGIYLVTDETYETRIVLDVAPGSPASDADIRPGDVLTGLEGTPASDLTLDEIRARLAGEGTVRLDLRREGTSRPVDLALRDLL